ncbi:MAG: uroporphyrinogen-III synthase [Melioribacteraceae bacterium]
MNSLKNKTILITKGKSECGKSLDILTGYGAEIIYFPTIKVVPLDHSPELNEALSIFNRFDYLVFTSTNSVEVFTAIAKLRNLDLSKIKIAVVGNSTAEECENAGLRVDIIPDEYSAEGLLYKFSEFELKNKKILIPGSSLSRGELNLGLTELGAQVFSVPIYDVLKNDLLNLKSEHQKIQKKHPGIFIFTSPSSFINLLKLMNVSDAEKFFDRSVLCAIGTTTETAMKERAITVHIVPKVFSLHGISEAIIEYFQLTENIA